MSYSSGRIEYIHNVFWGDYWANWLSCIELSWGPPEAHGESYDRGVRVGMT